MHHRLLPGHQLLSGGYDVWMGDPSSMESGRPSTERDVPLSLPDSSVESGLASIFFFEAALVINRESNDKVTNRRGISTTPE